MTLSSGTRLGAYEILTLIGSGGMGEVYKARDTRLDRTVAIKVLPADVSQDSELRARFEREARAIAALDHPHICALHDVGEHDGTLYLVMQHLEGETLAARLARSDGPLPLDQALTIAIVIADALDKAHRAGITHRDLKPANIMLTKAGAKLLDFGLAKLHGPAAPISMSGMTRLATPTPNTAHGTILGTVHYMAPEQVEGREADTRADIWALGVVIYEMATGARPFDGGSAASIIGAILKDRPAAISSRQPLAPPALDHVVGRCLEKDPDERWQTATDLKNELKWAAVAQATEAGARASPTATQPSRVFVALGAALGALAISMAVGWRYLTPAAAALPVVQFDVLPPTDAMLSPAPVASAAQIALSADGKIAFVALTRRGASQIYVRSLDSREARVLPGTDGASFPFWSPDGRYIGFFAHAKLKKIAEAGGASEVLCDAPAGRGGTWSSNGVILFSPTPNSVLSQIADVGGKPTPVNVARRDAEQFIGFNWPHFLPDGRHFLYYERTANPDYQGVYVGELATEARSPRVLAIDGMAVYGSGYLVFVREGVLFAQPFDVRTFRASGDIARIADHVGYFSKTFGYSAIAASPSGALAFGPSLGTTTSLRWFTRDGAPSGRLGRPDVYSSPRLSFDEKSVAVAITGPTMAERDIWAIDVARENPSRLTTDPSADWFPDWSPKDADIYFGSTRLGITSLFHKIGVGEETAVEKGPYVYAAYPNDLSRDGRLLAYQQSTPKGYDLGVMTLANVQRQSFLESAFNEVQARFAPSQRFIAYASDESGQFEIYVRPYPPNSSREWKVSLAGGMQPEWRRDGKELFFVGLDGKMMAVPVTSDGEFQAGTPHPLFEVEMPEAAAPYPTHYAVTGDGQRFLVNTVVDQPDRAAFTVILNWSEELKRLVPTK